MNELAWLNSSETSGAEICISYDFHISQNGILLLISFQPLKNVKPFLALELYKNRWQAGLGPGPRRDGSGFGSQADWGLNPGSDI